MDFEKMIEMCNEDELCECCKLHEDTCDGGVKNYGNGPIFPPCCEGVSYNELIDVDKLKEMVEGRENE